MNEWKIKEQQEKIDELERLLSEKASILNSEISMNLISVLKENKI